MMDQFGSIIERWVRPSGLAAMVERSLTVSRSAEHQHERVHEERRKEQRHRLILRVGVLEQGGTSSFCLVKNISANGVHLKTYVRPVIDAEATLRVSDEPAV